MRERERNYLTKCQYLYPDSGSWFRGEVARLRVGLVFNEKLSVSKKKERETLHFKNTEHKHL